MRNIKKILILLPIIILLSSCDFISYVDKTNNDNSPDLKTISDEKNDYIIQIENISSDSAYYDTERKKYMNYIMEAKAEINECTNIEQIEEIYSKYSKLIDELKTSLEYETELKEMKKKYLDLLNSVSNPDNYREDELLIYNECIEKGSNLINGLKKSQEDVFNQIYEIYKEAILKIKTDSEYRIEEENLQNKKNLYIKSIKDTVALENLREAEQKIYNDYISKATELINLLTDINDDNFNKIYEVYKEAISKIKTNDEYEIEEKELLDEKNKYIELLNSISSLDNYREKEQTLYTFYLDSGTSAINSEVLKDNVSKIYNTYKEIIEGIKTKDQYEKEEAIALLKYKEENISIINEYIDLSLYREKESDSISSLILEYTSLINQALNNKEIDDLVIDFKIKVYPFKTDKELYEEELEKLIIDSLNEIENYKSISNYRDNEALIVNELILSFDSQVEASTTKEFVLNLVEIYKSLIDTVKDDKTLYEEERLVLIEECYNEMLTLVDLDNMTEESKIDYLNYCSSVKNEMMTLSTKELIKTRLSQEKQSIYLLGAQLGDKNSLNELQELLSDDLENYLDPSLYREEQQTEILTIINSQSKIIKKQENYDDTLLCVDKAHDLLDAVLTNDEMWENYYIEFEKYIDLYTENKKLKKEIDVNNCKNWRDVGKAFDYYAYCLISNTNSNFDKIRLKLCFEYDENNINLNIYNNSELYVTNFNINYYFEMNDYIVIQYLHHIIIDENEIEKVPNPTKQYVDAVYYDTIANRTQTRSDSFDDFNYYNNANGELLVYNSQQLWYALENNYIPICKTGTSAYRLLEECKRILKEIVKTDMTEYEKIFVISRYLHNRCNSLNSNHKYKAFAEGIIFLGNGVCKSYARAMQILLGLEGIQCIIDSNYYVFQDGDHLLNYVKCKDTDKWYYLESHQILGWEHQSYRLMLNEKAHQVIRNSELTFSNDLCLDFYKHLRWGNDYSVLIESEEMLPLILDFYQNNYDFELALQYYPDKINLIEYLKQNDIQYTINPWIEKSRSKNQEVIIYR